MDTDDLYTCFLGHSSKGWISLVHAGGTDEFVTYILGIEADSVYLAKRLAPVKRQKTDDGPSWSVATLIVDLHWLLDVASLTNYDFQRSYQQYRSVVDDDVRFSCEVWAIVIDNLYQAVALQTM